MDAARDVGVRADALQCAPGQRVRCPLGTALPVTRCDPPPTSPYCRSTLTQERWHVPEGRHCNCSTGYAVLSQRAGAPFGRASHRRRAGLTYAEQRRGFDHTARGWHLSTLLVLDDNVHPDGATAHRLRAQLPAAAYVDDPQCAHCVCCPANLLSAESPTGSVLRHGPPGVTVFPEGIEKRRSAGLREARRRSVSMRCLQPWDRAGTRRNRSDSRDHLRIP